MRNYLTEQEIELTLQSVEKPMYLPVKMMVFTGRRIGEIALAKESDIIHDNQTMSFIQLKKRKKEYKELDISEIYEELVRFLNIERLNNSEYIFTPGNIKVKSWIKRVQRSLTKLGKQLGLPLHPHIFRHSFAVQFLKKRGKEYNGDYLRAAYELQQILGHVSIDTTLKYLAYVFAEKALTNIWGFENKIKEIEEGETDPPS